MIRRPPRSTQGVSSAASDVYKRQVQDIAFENGHAPNPVTLMVQSVFGLNPQWRGNMQEIQRLQAPEAAFPPALQWTDRPAIIFPLTNMFLYGMGPLAALLAWLGVCFALWRTVSGKRDWMVHAIPLFWTLFYFLFIGTRWVCLLYTSPSPRDGLLSRMPSSA